MSLMKLILLSKDEVTSLYYDRMQNDFIEDELKLLWVIHNAMDEGRYEPLGLSDGSALSKEHTEAWQRSTTRI